MPELITVSAQILFALQLSGDMSFPHGVHTAEQRTCPLPAMPSFCLTIAVGQTETADRLEGELDFNDRHGVGVFVIYKLLSGPDPTYHDDNYGLLTRDGLEKEAARRLSTWVKKH